MTITASGGFLTPEGIEYAFLPADPPESPPNHISVDGVTYEVDPQQCADYYTAQGKALPDKVTLHLPDGTNEVLSWVEYGNRFREWHAKAATQATASAASPSKPPKTTKAEA